MGNIPKCPIPRPVLVAAINATQAQFPGYCTDKWGEKEATYCRDLLPEEYQMIESDFIRHWCINARKRKAVDSVNGGVKRKKYQKPSGAYAHYLSSDHWKSFRKTILEFWNYSCCLCNSTKKLEVHHRTYERLGSERLNDCVCLCQTCHRKVHGGMQDGHEKFNVSLEENTSNDEQYLPLIF